MEEYFITTYFRVKSSVCNRNRERWLLVCHREPFKSRENHISCRALQSYNSSGYWARELFKPSTDSASLVDEIEKKFFRW